MIQHLELLAELMTTPAKEVSMDQMERDHARDYRVKGLFDDARAALNAVLADEDARRRLADAQERRAEDLAEAFKKHSAHVVRVWD